MPRFTTILATLATLLFTLATLAPLPARAETWPEHKTLYVNDYARILEDGAEARITAALKSLRDETGIEATVLTLHTRMGYQTSGTLESFATGLFNTWGIGDASRNDGILILVVSEDREMRVELGDGYGTAFNREAQDIIDRVFIPAFKAGDFSTGIEDGTAAVISRIARPHLAGDTPPDRAPLADSDSSSGAGIVGAVMALFAGIFGWAFFGARIHDRFTRCPECGQRGLDISRHVQHAATYSTTGSGEKIIACPHCGHHATSSYTIPRRSRSSSSGSSFGGGSSSGGGASGRW